MLTVIRKEKPLTEAEFARLKMDRDVRRLEIAGDVETNANTSRDRSLYQLHQLELKDALRSEVARTEPKFIRMGNTGCCGKGCNGCLVFWHDPAYAEGRELMKEKKMGERLQRSAHLG